MKNMARKILFWSAPKEEIPIGQIELWKESMKSLLKKIADDRDPEALKEAISFLKELSRKSENHDFVHEHGVVNLRRIFWPPQQDVSVYSTPVSNYHEALDNLLTTGLENFKRFQV
ncbi:MAG TPA: hypothetical protein VGV92_01465 [Gammaproteobacteria bacterium]|nr:hypothetical protein [Gammaproteobacteria bacterium]